MPTFKDTKGREWAINLTPFLFGKVRDRLKIDFYELTTDGFKRYPELLRDPSLFASVVFLCVESQAKELGVDSEEFGMSLDGDSLAEMEEAFTAALVFFSPKHQRETMNALIKKGREIQAKVTTDVLAKVQSLDANSLVESLKKQSGNSAAS